MASMTCTPAFLSSPTQRRSAISSFDSSVALYPKPPKSLPSTSVPQLDLRLFSPWNGLRHLGVSIRQNSVKIEIKRKGRGKVVHASLFGVGAPEALVIGVVALLVFGPKGLAEVARNLGKTLRSFQPTIRELQVVSREFKSTLEREIGLDDIPNSMQNTYSSTPSNATSTSSNTNSKSSQAVVDPNGVPSVERAYSSEDYLKITEEQLKAAAAQQQEQMPSQEEKSEPPPQPQATAPEVATTTPPPQGPKTET